MADVLVLDGAHGEGGGQIVRTALALAVVTGRPIRIHAIRGGRRRPGLAAQHITAVRAAGALCQAHITGDELGSAVLEFRPRCPARAGDYLFDVGAAREGGSAGAASLVVQTILLPLAFAAGESRLLVRGGTHVPRSPPFDYLREVWLSALRRTGVDAELELSAWGWLPTGGGTIRGVVRGGGKTLRPLRLETRGPLLRVVGRAVASNLPDHIPQRMAARARVLLSTLDCEVNISSESVPATSRGAGIFLTADYAHISAGFSALGAIRTPAEQVAGHAVALLHRHHASGGALDAHLADQILLPLAFAQEPSVFTAEYVSRHLETNAWCIERFGMAGIKIDRAEGGVGHVTVSPAPRPFA